MTTPFPPAGAPSPLLAEWGSRARAAALVGLLATPRDGLGAPTAGDTPADAEAWAAVDPITLAAIRSRADAERGTPWPQPLVSHYARYFRDGNRTAYEDLVRERQHRLSRAVVVAAHARATGAPESEADADADPLALAFLDEVIDGVALLCEQSSWSWGAHDDTFTAAGFVVPRAAHPYLDLGAGEVAGQLAIIDVVLGTALDERAPGLRERMRHETQLRVIRPFLERRDWHWLGLDGHVHNWNPWIHGNVVLAALALVDDPEERAEVVARAIEGIDRFLAALPADGAIDEGFSYWWNGACRALETLEILAAATEGALDASAIPIVRASVRFPHRMHVSGEWYVNVADGPARAGRGRPWHVPYRWGLAIADRDVAAHASAQKRPGEPIADEASGLARLVRALTDPGWRLAPTPPAVAPPLVAETWLPSVELLVARERAGASDGLTLWIKGGHNDENHNHLDVGTVGIAVDGVPVVVDAGQPTYTAQTFSPARYGIRSMQSGWHAVPAPWGLEQGVGAAFAATDARVALRSRGEATSGLALELATAYLLPLGSSLRRSVALAPGGADTAPAVVVTDAWTLPRPTAPGAAAVAFDGVLLHLLLHGEVELGSDADGPFAIVAPPGDGRAALLRWVTGAVGAGAVDAGASLEEWRLDDPLLEASWGERLTRLTLAVPAGAEHPFTGSVTFTLTAHTPAPAGRVPEPRNEARVYRDHTPTESPR